MSPGTDSTAGEPKAYTGARRQLSLALLVAANLLPLLGVIWFDWDVAALVVLYWSENLVIGFYNLLKMFSLGRLSAIPTALFFLVHYGGFCAVHGFFILSLLLEAPSSFGEEPSWPLFLVFVQLLVDVTAEVLAQAPPEWRLAVAGLLVSHGYSFVSNFLLAGERNGASARGLMAAPYKRIVILHVTIIAGSFAVLSLGQPVGLLVVLVIMKIAMDVALHLREHRSP